ncbi:hypothetical protein [Pectinatus frisingensis]|uniref:hypothetical protein n=1 Tax=Pectinatus frisingensis TaxID=865 RepID=UPI0018C76314|nr:hypothetical protein [Pectinatus frisingensis]
MSLRIMSVRYIEDIKNNPDKYEIINLEDMTEEIYKSKYEGKLYYPNPDCTAPIVFVESEKLEKHFRTFPTPNIANTHNLHVVGCPHCVEFDENGIPRQENVVITAEDVFREHIIELLKYQYDKLMGKKKKTKRDKKNNKKNDSKHIDENATNSKKVPGNLEGETKKKKRTKREPSLLGQSINDISADDYSTSTISVKTVRG